jgi:fatty-acyl-CoA synthase/long-chain acyl-CoA synthetase
VAVDFLASHAESLPDKPAVICGDRVLDFATLNKRASRVANAFTTLGCREGDRVAWMSFNSIEGAEIANGSRRAGLVIVPVNYRLRGPEIAYVLNDSGAKIAATGLDHAQAMASAAIDVENDVTFVTAGGVIPQGWRSYRELIDAASDRFTSVGDGLGASMIYTSGTTGNPKGAWRPHGVDIANVLQVIATFDLAQSDVHLMCGPGYHSGVAFFSALHQVLGSTVVLQPRFDAQQALSEIERHRATTTFMAPTLLQRLVEAQEERPRNTSSLRAVILGAAPCPYALKVRAEAVFGQVVWEFYGATETGINTVLRPEDQLRKPGSCGTALPGQEIRLVRTDGTEAAIGEPGELMVRSNWLAEYFNRPEATRGSLHDGFFSVGDEAYRDEEGYFYICDRRIDMIISGGMNVYPAEVEAVLHAHPAVMDAAVIGVPDDQWGESVKAVVQPRPGADVTSDALMAFCGERLAGFKKPRSIDFVDELPRDAAGKLLKRKLRESYWAGSGRNI